MSTESSPGFDPILDSAPDDELWAHNQWPRNEAEFYLQTAREAVEDAIETFKSYEPSVRLLDSLVHRLVTHGHADLAMQLAEYGSEMIKW